MASNAAPTRAQQFAALRKFLADNGVASFRMGFFMPGEDGTNLSNLPLAAFLPQPQRVEQGASGGGSFTDEEIQVQVVFPTDAAGPYSDTYGGWAAAGGPWAFRDAIFTGAHSIARWHLDYGSGQFEAQISGYEEWTWYAAESTVALMVQLTVKMKTIIAPAAANAPGPLNILTD